MQQTAVISQPLSRAEYDRLVLQGRFDDMRVELVRGAVVPMSPQGPLHSTVVRNLIRVLVTAIGDRAVVQIQAPLAASDDSEPEPDAAIIPHGDYHQEHPTQAYLVVEVSGSSRTKDRGEKAALYAECGVPEYWLIDLERRVIEVRTSPLGGVYGRLVTLPPAADSEDVTITLVAFPDIQIPIAQIW